MTRGATARREEVVLIGPPASGKSTQAHLLSERLRLPRRALDEYRWRYYYEVGYDAETAQSIFDRHGFAALYQYWKRFDRHAVRRFFGELRNCVFELGAGHSVYTDELEFEEVRELFSAFRHVVLLLPSRDKDRSIEVIRARRPVDDEGGLVLCDHFLRHPSNQALATRVVYTDGVSPSDTCDEILRAISSEVNGATMDVPGRGPA